MAGNWLRPMFFMIRTWKWRMASHIFHFIWPHYYSLNVSDFAHGDTLTAIATAYEEYMLWVLVLICAFFVICHIILVLSTPRLLAKVLLTKKTKGLYAHLSSWHIDPCRFPVKCGWIYVCWAPYVVTLAFILPIFNHLARIRWALYITAIYHFKCLKQLSPTLYWAKLIAEEYTIIIVWAGKVFFTHRLPNILIAIIVKLTLHDFLTFWQIQISYVYSTLYLHVMDLNSRPRNFLLLCSSLPA